MSSSMYVIFRLLVVGAGSVVDLLLFSVALEFASISCTFGAPSFGLFRAGDLAGTGGVLWVELAFVVLIFCGVLFLVGLPGDDARVVFFLVVFVWRRRVAGVLVLWVRRLVT